MNNPFAVTAWAVTAIFAGLTYVAETTFMTVTGRAFSATIADRADFLGHKKSFLSVSLLDLVYDVAYDCSDDASKEEFGYATCDGAEDGTKNS